MKIFYSIIFAFAVTIPIFSQTTNNLKPNYLKADTQPYCDNLIRSENTEKFVKQSPQKLPDQFIPPDTIRFMPLPLATPYISQAELLPLYKPGESVILFLNKKKNSSIVNFYHNKVMK